MWAAGSALPKEKEPAGRPDGSNYGRESRERGNVGAGRGRQEGGKQAEERKELGGEPWPVQRRELRSPSSWYGQGKDVGSRAHGSLGLCSAFITLSLWPWAKPFTPLSPEPLPFLSTDQTGRTSSSLGHSEEMD